MGRHEEVARSRLLLIDGGIVGDAVLIGGKSGRKWPRADYVRGRPHVLADVHRARNWLYAWSTAPRNGEPLLVAERSDGCLSSSGRIWPREGRNRGSLSLGEFELEDYSNRVPTSAILVGTSGISRTNFGDGRRAGCSTGRRVIEDGVPIEREIMSLVQAYARSRR